MIRTFKTRIYPDAQQRQYLHKAFGIRRWTWNYALAYYFDQVKEQKYPTGNAIQKHINNDVAGAPGYEWLDEVNTMVRSEAIKDLTTAIDSWRKLHKESRTSLEIRDSDKGKPKFKKKGKCVESCRLFRKCDSVFKVESKHHFSVTTVQRMPRLNVQTRESLEFLQSPGVCIKLCTFSREAGNYYMSLTYEKTNQRPRASGSGTVGIDLGIKHVAACWDGSNGRIFDVPSTLSAAERYTELQNKRFSRTVPGSKRHERAKVRLQRAYKHEANIKKDAREKLTTFLTSNYDTVKYDDFSFTGAMNLDCNRALYRVGVCAFKERLTVKAAERGVELTKVKPFTPTTKTCSQCGYVKKSISLKTRVYECPQCSSKVDRDLNAAMNVYNLCS